MAVPSVQATCELGSQISPASSERMDGDTDRSKSDDGLPTPTRKNKRKMTEPRRRSDFSIKRFCPDSSGSTSDHAESDIEDLREVPPKESPGNSAGTDPEDNSRSTPLPREGFYRAETMLALPHSALPLPDHRLHPAFGIHPHLLTGMAIHPLVGGIPAGLRHRAPVMLPHPHNNFSTVSKTSPQSQDSNDGSSGKKSRKNYKNMTRERRVEANARERTRVHTISAAFESLRRAVPSYSYNQKLSKLAILRIACSYILALAKLADLDYGKGDRDISFAECVDLCTKTIQTEGRARRRH